MNESSITPDNSASHKLAAYKRRSTW